MEVEEIPSDEVIEMSSVMHRAFKAGGCRPLCHGCGKWLDVGSKFKLQTVNTTLRYDGVNIDTGRNIESREVMLCDICTPEDVEKSAKQAHSAYNKKRESGGGCYRVNGKIVH